MVEGDGFLLSVRTDDGGTESAFYPNRKSKHKLKEAAPGDGGASCI